MRALDRFIQARRIGAALPWLAGCRRVIDIGAHEGELFERLGDRLDEGWGVEPLLAVETERPRYRLVPGLFPARRPAGNGWDAITLLAVLEHVPRMDQPGLADACHALLRPGGRVIVTVPSPATDRILAVLTRLRLIDGMSLEEHYGFEPADTLALFSAPGFRLLAARRFQLGLNNLFVFERS